MDTQKFVNELIALAKENIDIGHINASIIDKNELQQYDLSEVIQLLAKQSYKLVELENSPLAAMPLKNKMVVISNDINYNEQVIKPKIGRNDSCPCGSGKKYKHCCGK